MKNLLVCIDFHNKTQILVDKAFEIAKPLGAKIWILHVAAPDPDFVGYDVGPQYIRDFRAEELKEEHRKIFEYTTALNDKGVEAEGLLIQGATIEIILEEAKKLDIDLICSGHFDHSFAYDLFFGNTSLQIIRKSNIPVLVVPFGE